MKIALINAAELEMSPYIRTYMESLDLIGGDYDVIEWRRDLSFCEPGNHIIPFNYHSSISKKPVSKLVDYWRFSRFAKKTIRKNKYDRLIIFEYQTALFLRPFILKEYNGRYLLDIRDYSGRYKYIRRFIKGVDECAFARVVSSHGYKEWTFPVNREVVCHNTTLERMDNLNDIKDNPFHNQIIVLTNGVLRTYEMDKKVVDAFSGTNVFFRFSGKGKDSELYQQLANNNSRVEYTGYYKREDELSIARSASFINIFLEDTPCYNTAMSNRFYLSIMAGVPMIVNSQNIQANYVSKYNLGIVADSPSDIPSKMRDYISKFNIEEYNKGRKDVAYGIKMDLLEFQSLIREFANK